jgi:hypothetical protein
MIWDLHCIKGLPSLYDYIKQWKLVMSEMRLFQKIQIQGWDSTKQGMGTMAWWE